MFGTLIYGLVVSIMNINNSIQHVGGAKIWILFIKNNEHALVIIYIIFILSIGS
jgi:hypothetical protein